MVADTYSNGRVAWHGSSGDGGQLVTFFGVCGNGKLWWLLGGMVGWFGGHNSGIRMGYCLSFILEGVREHVLHIILKCLDLWILSTLKLESFLRMS